MKAPFCFFAVVLLPLPLWAASANLPSFKAVEIDAKIEIGYGVTVADVDGDKKPDIILADKNQIVWYQNPTWEKHIIVENLTKLDHVCIAARDLDGDGKVELAAGAGWNPGDTLNSGAVFYLIPPADRKQRWEPVELPHEPTVHRMRWVKNNRGDFDLVVVPLHGRGNNPGAGTGQGVKISVYHKPPNPKDAWTVESPDYTLHKTHNLEVIQAEGGNGEDLLVASKEGVFRLTRTDKGSTLQQISGVESGGAGEARLGKLSGGRHFIATVEPMHGTNLVVYLDPTDQGGKQLWARQVLDSSLVDGHALACGDLTGQGQDQIVVGWRAMGKSGAKVGIKLFQPLSPAGEKWKEMLVDDNTMACEDLCLADLDGDGRLDIIAAGRATKNVKIYFNQGPAGHP
jgi:hypothetical protein